MKKIFLDTNFLMDAFVREEYFDECDYFLRKSSEAGYEFFISYLSVANFAYINRKETTEKILLLISKLIENFNVISNSKEQIKKALSFYERDFEDVLQYQTALDGNCDYIITRNKQDFHFSEIPVYCAKEFVKLIIEGN